MQSAQQSAVRVLQLMMAATVVLPTTVFILAAVIDYRQAHVVAAERTERSVDILHEHALKVFQTVERTIAEVQEVVRGMADPSIAAEQNRLHDRLQQIVTAVPQLQAIAVLNRDGRPLASSSMAPVPDTATAADRSYFKAQAAGATGTHVSDLMTTRWSGPAQPFFVLSRSRPTADGAFDGAIAVAVQHNYFDEFYARIGQGGGTLYALVRDDGAVLARYPRPLDKARVLDMNSPLRRAMVTGVEQGTYTARSQLDAVERAMVYRKLTGFPVYVVAGVETSAVRAEWLSALMGHLVFGLPATLLLLWMIRLALERTRKLHAEAERRVVAETALRQAQRLEAIGQLTGGVAHDFNNLLMIVTGSVERLRRDLTGDKHIRLLDMITTATQRGESLTRQLLTFSRRQTLTPAVIDLRQRLPELKEMLNRSLRGDIETEVVVPTGPCAIKVDSSEFELALLNLAVNARDAMPHGGTLSITARPVTLQGKANEEGLKGDFMAIRVADTGTGIPSEALPHVFEPFFTTKEVGKGTGLGLSQVYGFAKQSGGTATVTSAVGRGTVITLYLPRTEETAAPVAITPREEAAPKRDGTVLLVEDNADVAEVGRSYFEQLGYRVKHANSAQGALERLENESDIDLVFSDILMPGVMNGTELAQSVRDRFPAIPVLLATGYSSSAQAAVREGFIVLQKPFDLATLEKGLRDAIARKARAGSDQELAAE
jgi:two-component system NtrC family sensor kinase